MKAVIMAGGEGTRLRPLTCTKPKPMVYLANVPVMTHAIELLKKHGIKEIGVTLQYMAPQIMDYYGDGREYGVKLHYFLEDMPLGTAGSVKNAEAFLDETFLVISGDALTDINLSEAIEFHRRKKSVATLILSSVANPLEYGIVISKKSGEIIRFLEKPSWGEVFSDQVNTGMYILEPEILNYIPPKTNFDFSKNLFPLLMEGGHVLYGYPAKGYWCDIGNPQSYLQANADILLNNIVLNLPYDQYAPGIWVGKNTEIDPTARLEAPLIIGHNCYVGPRVSLSEYCVIGDNCRIGEGASLKRPVLWNGAAVG
ncbi:MAG TPA: NDP-sugar synthase, partial [Clostridia bacterium]|nr:NDP-sugar synthase [Clostridia bacterium]